MHHACWLLSAISGILAGGILGFGTADRFLFLHLRFDLAVVWLCCFALCKIIPNSSAHKLSAMMGHFHYGVSVSLVVWCCFAFAAWFVFGSVFCWFSFSLSPCSGLRTT